jgi:hypothetical protein
MRRGRKEACNWCIVFIPANSTGPAGEEEIRFSAFGDADENDLQMLKPTVMTIMNTIPTSSAILCHQHRKHLMQL